VGTGTSEDAQPFHVNFPVGVAMAHNGNVTNFHELREIDDAQRLHAPQQLLRPRGDPLRVRAGALGRVLKPGIPATHEDVFAAVAAVLREVRGAYSVVALVPDVGLVAFRDPYGIKPPSWARRRPRTACGTPPLRRAWCSTSSATRS
jgi:amidophosphoribosyltransferase